MTDAQARMLTCSMLFVGATVLGTQGSWWVKLIAFCLGFPMLLSAFAELIRIRHRS